MKIKGEIINAFVNYELNPETLIETCKVKIITKFTIDYNGVTETNEVSNTFQIKDDSIISQFRDAKTEHDIVEVVKKYGKRNIA